MERRAGVNRGVFAAHSELVRPGKERGNDRFPMRQGLPLRCILTTGERDVASVIDEVLDGCLIQRVHQYGPIWSLRYRSPRPKLEKKRLPPGRRSDATSTRMSRPRWELIVSIHRRADDLADRRGQGPFLVRVFVSHSVPPGRSYKTSAHRRAAHHFTFSLEPVICPKACTRRHEGSSELRQYPRFRWFFLRGRRYFEHEPGLTFEGWIALIFFPFLWLNYERGVVLKEPPLSRIPNRFMAAKSSLNVAKMKVWVINAHK